MPGPGVFGLTAGTQYSVAGVCRDCVWWQSPGNRTASKNRWIERAEEEWGEWGSLYLDDHGRLLGSLQYGPSHLFPRAADLPAGPASDDAALVTCVYLVPDASGWVEKSLLLAAIGESRDRGIAALEAFAYRYPEGETQEERFLVHRTVFPRDFLDEFGFVTLRAQGKVEPAGLSSRAFSRSRKDVAQRCCVSSRMRSRRPLSRCRVPSLASLRRGTRRVELARCAPRSLHRGTSAATSTSSRSSTRTPADRRGARRVGPC